MIKTIGELKKAIEKIDDDFTIDVRIVRELSEEELKDSKYPYPYEYSKANIEIGDIGYSDNDVFINVYEGVVSDDVCEWHKVKNGNAYKSTTHAEIHDSRVLDWCRCPYCGKKIKVVDNDK